MPSSALPRMTLTHTTVPMQRPTVEVVRRGVQQRIPKPGDVVTAKVGSRPRQCTPCTLGVRAYPHWRTHSICIRVAESVQSCRAPWILPHSRMVPEEPDNNDGSVPWESLPSAGCCARQLCLKTAPVTPGAGHAHQPAPGVPGRPVRWRPAARHYLHRRHPVGIRQSLHLRLNDTVSATIR